MNTHTEKSVVYLREHRTDTKKMTPIKDWGFPLHFPMGDGFHLIAEIPPECGVRHSELLLDLGVCLKPIEHLMTELGGEVSL